MQPLLMITDIILMGYCFRLLIKILLTVDINSLNDAAKSPYLVYAKLGSRMFGKIDLKMVSCWIVKTYLHAR